MKVFLGGTCNGSSWRDILIPKLKCDFFNPVVEDWTPACQAREIEERKNADIALYTITPKMTGVYSIAEVVDDSNKQPKKTMLVCCLADGVDIFNHQQVKSLSQLCKMIKANGGYACVLNTVEDIVVIADGFNEQHQRHNENISNNL